MLPDDCQRVIAMRFGGGMSIDEISARAGINTAAVRDIIRQSLQLLRERLRGDLLAARDHAANRDSTFCRRRI